MIRPVILCGGAGTRLWPVSRQGFPKHLLAVVGKETLLQQTAGRLSREPFAPAIVVSGEDQAPFVREQLQRSDVAVEAIILEPAARNTAAAAALAAAWVALRSEDELLLLMPSDHLIGDPGAFMRAVDTGIPHAEKGAIVTLGVTPTEPNTQYGYIEADSERGSPDGSFPVARFHEKPSAEKAAQYVASGKFFWNAGVFLAKASTVIGEMRLFLPRSMDAVSTAVAGARTDDVFVRPTEDAFNRVESISIDHGIMEKTSRAVVVPVQMDWSDVGSWDAVWKLAEKDANGNAIHGDVLALDTCGSILRSEGGPLLTAVGLNNMVVIAVGDAVLVSPMNRVAEVKRIVEMLKTQRREQVRSQVEISRSWGPEEIFAKIGNICVKRVLVDAGETRENRTAHQIHCLVIRGSADVTVEGKRSALHENESMHIPAGVDWKITNTANVRLELIQIGSPE